MVIGTLLHHHVTGTELSFEKITLVAKWRLDWGTADKHGSIAQIHYHILSMCLPLHLCAECSTSIPAGSL